MRADVQGILDGWSALDRGEARRLRNSDRVSRLENVAGVEPVIWFQTVEWSEPLFAAAPSLQSEPDAGVLALTATRLILIGRDASSWPLVSIQRFVFHPAKFGEGTPPHFAVHTPAGLQNLVLGRRASQQPMLTHVSDALAVIGARLATAPAPGPRRAPGPDEDGGRLDAVIGELATLRDRGTITQAQFDEERRRLLG